MRNPGIDDPKNVSTVQDVSAMPLGLSALSVPSRTPKTMAMSSPEPIRMSVGPILLPIASITVTLRLE